MANIEIGEMDYLADPPYKPVLLNGKEIFRLDFSTYMGHRRTQDKDLCNVLSEILGYDVSSRQLNTSLMTGVISDTQPED